MFHHDIGIVKVATVDDDGITKGLVEPVKVQGGEFRPVGKDDQSIGVLGRSIGVGYITKIGPGRKHLLGALDRCGVIGSDRTALGKQHLDDIDRGRFADVVGLSFEGQAQNADAFAAKGPQGGTDLIEEAPLLLGVDLFDFGEESEVDAQLLGHGTEGGYVLGKAGAAVADTGAEEPSADAAVEAHAAGYLLHVGVGGFA